MNGNSVPLESAQAEVEHIRRNTILASLYLLLEYLKAHPQVPLPVVQYQNAFAEKDQLSEVARALAPCEKTVVGEFFTLSRDFGEIAYQVNFPREDVCTRVVTGIEQVPEQVIPAHEKEIVRWECPDSILNGADER